MGEVDPLNNESIMDTEKVDQVLPTHTRPNTFWLKHLLCNCCEHNA